MIKEGIHLVNLISSFHNFSLPLSLPLSLLSSCYSILFSPLTLSSYSPLLFLPSPIPSFHFPLLSPFPLIPPLPSVYFFFLFSSFISNSIFNPNPYNPSLILPYPTLPKIHELLETNVTTRHSAKPSPSPFPSFPPPRPPPSFPLPKRDRKEKKRRMTRCGNVMQ